MVRLKDVEVWGQSTAFSLSFNPKLTQEAWLQPTPLITAPGQQALIPPADH